jgi:hypothetical protein
MKDEDIIGKEFTCFEFANDGKLDYNDTHKKAVGCSAKVLNFHSRFKQYSYVDVTFKNGTKTKLHFPTAIIKQQLEEIKRKEEMSTEDILNEMKQILSTL